MPFCDIFFPLLSAKMSELAALLICTAGQLWDRSRNKAVTFQIDPKDVSLLVLQQLISEYCFLSVA